MAEMFTLVAMPDTQYETQLHPAMLQSQVDWIVNNQASQNIAFVAQLGDITQTGSARQYATAHNILFQLNNADNLPWGVCRGNHDTHPALYDEYFGPSNFIGEDWYGTSTDSHSSYQTFQADGRTYLVLDIEYNASLSVLNWAQSVISAHPGMPTIINTHNYLGSKGKVSAWGKTMWSKPLTGNPKGLVNGNSQVFMVLCGHRGYDYNATAIDAAGKPVFEVLSNYQKIHSGDGYMRLYQFDEDNSAIHVVTYSPYDTANPYLTNPVKPFINSANQFDSFANQFDIPMNFDQRLGAVPDQPLALALNQPLGLALNQPLGLARNLQFTLAPEPSTLVLTALGAATLLAYYCCKRRA